MSRQNVQIHAVTDLVMEKNSYWSKASDLAARLLESDNANEILADFITKMAYSPSEADPIQVLGTVCWDWDCMIEEEEEEFEFVA